jgi:hypothetical protein
MALPAETADAARLDVWLLDYCQREGVAVVPRRVVQTYLHPTVRMAPHSVGNPHKH